MADHGDCLIVIATYNERETLPPLLQAIFATVPSVDVVVVDDNSPDGTGHWCDEYSQRDPRVRCLHRPGKLGLGTAIIAGLREGIAQGYRYVVTMDADLSHNPASIPELINAMEPAEGPKVDVAIGSRYVPGGRIEGWPLRRHVMSRLINIFSRVLLGLPVRDCSGNFRCYRAAALARLDFNEFCASGYAFFEEILFRLRKNGATFKEIPITFVDRRKGASKITWGEGIRTAWVIMKLALRERCARRKFSSSAETRGLHQSKREPQMPKQPR